MPMMLPTVGTQCDSRIKLKLNQSQFPEDSTPRRFLSYINKTNKISVSLLLIEREELTFDWRCCSYTSATGQHLPAETSTERDNKELTFTFIFAWWSWSFTFLIRFDIRFNKPLFKPLYNVISPCYWEFNSKLKLLKSSYTSSTGFFISSFHPGSLSSSLQHAEPLFPV